MATLVNRLEKLEKDLQILTAMQHLITEVEFPVDCLDIPTRDAPIANSTANAKVALKKCSGILKTFRPPPPEIKQLPVTQCQQFTATNGAPLVQTQQHLHETLQKVFNLESKLTLEETNRSEAEEAKKTLLDKLHQKERELERETECKNGLLRLTLQIKTQLQEKCAQVLDLKKDLENLKIQHNKTLEDVDSLRLHNDQISKESLTLLKSLDALKMDKHNFEQSITELEQKRKDELLSYEQKENILTRQEHKLLTQVDQLVTKCSQIDQSRETAVTAQNQLQQNLDSKDGEVKTLVEKVAKMDSAFQRSSALYQCAMDKLQLDLETQVNLRNQKLASCYSTLLETKRLLEKLYEDKKSLEDSLEREVRSNKDLLAKLEETCAELENLEKSKTIDSKKHKCFLNESELTLQKVTQKSQEYQRTILKIKVENSRLSKRLVAEEQEYFQKLKDNETKNGILEEKHRNCEKELKNLTDNFSILQKISEDQIRSIQKLKSEAEDLRKSEFALKLQVRNLEEVQEASCRKINGQTEIIADYENEVEYLQNKLLSVQDDLKKHNCEDFVESTCKRKVIQLETHLMKQKTEWESILQNLTLERDRAVAAAKRAVNRTVEMKADLETTLTEVKSDGKRELLQLQTDSRKELAEKNLQIQNLETEIEKVRQYSTQLQHTLSQKIHQLQSALNICVGSFSQQQAPTLLQQSSFIPHGISQPFGSTFLG